MFAQGQTVIQIMEQFAPKRYAVPNDRIGLQLGSLQKPIQKVLIALDITLEVVDEAIEQGANLIIAHHAIIFRPLDHLQTDTPAGKLYEKLIKHDIAVYISHTNLDTTPDGMNDLMAELLGLTQGDILESVYEDRLYKLVVFVPTEHAESVQQAMFSAGAGHIGEYSHCSYRIEGRGTFLPGEHTDPFSGQKGELSIVNETRIETIVPASLKNKVIQAMIKSHPYEEVAYDVYPLDIKGKQIGLGKVGKLPKSMPLHELVQMVKHVFDVPMVRMVGDSTRIVSKVALLGGSGSRYLKHALFAGADVYITGDIDYHTAHDALAAGIALIDPGHNIEKIIKERVAAYLNEQLAGKKSKTMAIASALSTEPFQFV